jgi:hypothetical protein
MELTGTVVDQSTGLPIANVQIWEIDPDGQAASVIGYSDPKGNFDVQVTSASSSINFAQDGYTGVALPFAQAQNSDQVLLQPDGSVSAKITLSGIPSWVWVALAFVGIFFIGDGKKKK